MAFKDVTIFNPSLLSGSSDAFRNAFGGVYTEAETDEGKKYSFLSADTLKPHSEAFDKVFFDLENQKNSDYSNLIPNFSFPVRIASNSEEIKNDQDWRAYILGGTFGQKTYTTKFSDTTEELTSFTYDSPYTQQESLSLADSGITNIIQISYDYTQHLQEYESTINTFESEKYIPNYYILSDLYLHKDQELSQIEKVYPAELIDFASLNSSYETPQLLFGFNASKIPYSLPQSHIDSFTDTRKLNTNLVINYLTASAFSEPAQQETADWADTKQKTIFLDNQAIVNLLEMEDLQDTLPYKMKISFPSQATKDFAQNYRDNEFDSRMLLALDEAFIQQEVLTTTSQEYQKNIEFMQANYDGIVSTVQEVETSNYREIDYIEFLTYCRDKYINDNNEAMFVGPNNIRRSSALDEKGGYRHVNTKASLAALEYAVSFLNDSTKAGLNSWEDLFSENSNYEETIAYRVEKIGGSASNDNFTQTALQNFWFFNSEGSDDFKFFDSQVKFNSDYSYNVYAYVLTAGVKYQYSDLLLSRDLSCTEELSENTTINYLYGLEFYDPNGEDGNRQDRLYDDGDLSDFDDSAGGTYGTEAQIYSNYRYLADFKILYEPFLKIIEVPIYSKTLRVLDNPPNRLNITPYQIMDDSQNIAFNLRYNTFSEVNYPSVISREDSEYKERYLNGKDLTETTKITEASVSKQRTIEVYRLDFKPTSLQDFDGNIHKTLDLKTPGQKFYREVEHTCISQIETNKKYYYLFRVLNEHGTPGHVSEIYETELVNDGGYKFALFNAIPESELGEDIAPKTDKQVKKLFQLRPKLGQIKIDTSDVDFAQSAESQLQNIKIGTSDDLIWDKTFKIRLTSKKTGKKIDLNITYKISSE